MKKTKIPKHNPKPASKSPNNIVLWAVFAILVLILVKIFFRSVTERQKGVEVFFKPDSVNTESVNETTVSLMANSFGKKIAFVRVEFSFDPSLLQMETDFVINPNLSNTIVKTNTDEINTKGEATLVVAANPGDAIPEGVVEIATFKIKGKPGATGKASFLLKPESMQIVDAEAQELSIFAKR